MKSVSPETVKSAITQAYNDHNPTGKKDMWNTVLNVIRHGLSHENGNPWKEILEHWSMTDKQYKKERHRRYWHWDSSKYNNWGGYGGCRSRKYRGERLY